LAGRRSVVISHLSLHKDAPIPRAVQTIGRTLAVPVLADCTINILERRFPTGTAAQRNYAENDNSPSFQQLEFFDHTVSCCIWPRNDCLKIMTQEFPGQTFISRCI
jgi:hypothetical protein